MSEERAEYGAVDLAKYHALLQKCQKLTVEKMHWENEAARLQRVVDFYMQGEKKGGK